MRWLCRPDILSPNHYSQFLFKRGSCFKAYQNGKKPVSLRFFPVINGEEQSIALTSVKRMVVVIAMIPTLSDNNISPQIALQKQGGKLLCLSFKASEKVDLMLDKIFGQFYNTFFKPFFFWREMAVRPHSAPSLSPQNYPSILLKVWFAKKRKGGLIQLQFRLKQVELLEAITHNSINYSQ